MDSVAPGVHLSGDHHNVADLQLANLLFADWRNQRLFISGHPEAFTCRDVLFGPGFVAIEPPLDLSALRVEHNSEPSKRPAVVGYRHEETRGQPIERTDLAADQRH